MDCRSTPVEDIPPKVVDIDGSEAGPAIVISDAGLYLSVSTPRLDWASSPT